MKRTAALILACLTACTGQPQPLQVPIAPDHALQSGLRIALADADLPALAQTAMLTLGKQPTVTLDAWTVAPLPLDATVATTQWPLAVENLTLHWVNAGEGAGRLRATFHVPPVTGPVSLEVANQPSCPLTWSATSGEGTLDLAIGRATGGALTIDAVPPVGGANPAGVAWANPVAGDVSQCFGPLPPSTAALVAGYLSDSLGKALTGAVATALAAPLRTLWTPGLELSGQIAVHEAHGTPIDARWQVVRAGDPAGGVVSHVGEVAASQLLVALDADRHPCVADAPMPQTIASPLAQVQAPPGPAYIRRALVVDAALIQRLAWMAHRSGLLCATSPGDLGAALPPGWAADVVPELEAWIDGPPARARFWPGPPPQTRLVDTPAGPGVEWTASGATLEVTAEVAGTELVVLTMTGTFRAVLLPRLLSTHVVQFELATVERVTTQQQSPLVGDLNVPSEAALSTLATVALQGIFSNRAVLPLLGLTPAPLPPGTVLTRIDHAGDALWLWLDGGGG